MGRNPVKTGGANQSQAQLSCDYGEAISHCQRDSGADSEKFPQVFGPKSFDQLTESASSARRLLNCTPTNHSKISPGVTAPTVADRGLRISTESGLMPSKTASAERQLLRARVRELGLRCTAARLAVLGELQRSTSPLTLAEVARALAPLEFDRATVYRNLMELSESGLVSRLELGDHLWRYELRKNDQDERAEHAHFLCTKCGEVSCLDGIKIRVTPAPRRKRSPLGNVTEILLKGRCARCS